MKLILLENMKNLGPLGKKINVKPGFARNYLIPKKKAVLATEQNIKFFEEQKEELQEKEIQRIKQLEKRASKLNGLQIQIAALVSEEGKLYGSIGVTDIADAIINMGGSIEKHEVILPHGTIKELGTYDVQLNLNHGEILATINLNVVAKDKS